MDSDIIFPFEFYISGKPASLQGSSKSKEIWQSNVKKQAINTRSDQGAIYLYSDPVSVDILYFREDGAQGDVDNIIKPILDALCKVIYADDVQVERVSAQVVDDRSAILPESTSDVFLSAMDCDPPCVYICVKNDLKWRALS